MPQLPDNLWITVLILGAILALLIVGYRRSLPKKKTEPVVPAMSTTRVVANEMPAGLMRSQMVPRPSSRATGNPANARPLREAPRRSMHRDDGYVGYGVPANDHPVYDPPGSAHTSQAYDHSHSVSSPAFSSDSGSSSSSSSDSGGSSGGGDGGGGGGGD